MSLVALGHVMSGSWEDVEELPADVRRHYLDPAEVVPLCMVLATWVPTVRDEVCVAVRSPEGVTCTECLDGLATRSGLPLAP